MLCNNALLWTRWIILKIQKFTSHLDKISQLQYSSQGTRCTNIHLTRIQDNSYNIGRYNVKKEGLICSTYSRKHTATWKQTCSLGCKSYKITLTKPHELWLHPLPPLLLQLLVFNKNSICCYVGQAKRCTMCTEKANVWIVWSGEHLNVAAPLFNHEIRLHVN